MNSNSIDLAAALNAKQLKIAIIGAGLSGIAAAIKFRSAGHDNIVIYEKADNLGGTWYQCTYPGVACDIPTHAYSYSFEQNPNWSMNRAPGNEIFDYLVGVVDKYQLREQIVFNTEVTEAHFNDSKWTLTTSTGDTAEYDVVVAASGTLHHPAIAQFEGMESFKGAAFHPAHWDHSVELEGKKVGLIGVGSTGVQIAGALVDKVEKLTVFQRTPQWMVSVEAEPFTEEDKSEFLNSPYKMNHLRHEENGAWFFLADNALHDVESPYYQAIEQVCLEYLESSVEDPELREKLRPTYRPGCKRLVVSPDFYQNIQKPNAELVTENIECVEPEGIRTVDGQLHELDVIVISTGFDIKAFIRPAKVVGRNGKSIDELWGQTPYSYMGVALPDFPNFFFINGPTGPLGNLSLFFVAEKQAEYIVHLLEELRRNTCNEISPSTDATEAFLKENREAMKKTVWATGCNSFYLGEDGFPTTWGLPVTRFIKEMSYPELSDYDKR